MDYKNVIRVILLSMVLVSTIVESVYSIDNLIIELNDSECENEKSETEKKDSDNEKFVEFFHWSLKSSDHLFSTQFQYTVSDQDDYKPDHLIPPESK